MKTTTTAPAAAGLALASLAAELLAQGIAAVLAPAVALALTLAGCGHELALAARRRREAMATAAEPAAEASPEVEPVAEASPEVEPVAEASPEVEPVAEASPEAEPGWELGDHYIAACRREAQTQAYGSLAGLAVRELRQLARQAGHSQLARRGRRSELLAALVPA
jgi:hypothetical protein